MKTNIILPLIAAVLLSACGKDNNTFNKEKADGFLSFDNWELAVDDAVEMTKAVSPAGGQYTVIISDKSGSLPDIVTTYAAIKSSGNRISLPAGNYTVTARSTAEAVPAAAFESPVYGASRNVTIVSGQTATITDFVCRLLQTKVTVAYSDDLLAMIDGDCTVTVSVSPSAPLQYKVDYSGGKASYDQSAGYFAVNNGGSTTMDITFKGHVEGGLKTMTQALADIRPCTWHQIKFIKKINQEGNADIDVVITDLIDDEELNNDIPAGEDIIGDDPEAPQGDGGIMLESTCGYDITNPITVPDAAGTFNLTMKATVPGKVKRFTVEVSSTSPVFIGAVGAINDGSNVLDLVNPSDGAKAVFSEILPFPYGDAVNNQSEVEFDLSDAQAPLLAFAGTHTFTMHVTDQTGCKKDISIELVVE